LSWYLTKATVGSFQTVPVIPSVGFLFVKSTLNDLRIKQLGSVYSSVQMSGCHYIGII